MAEHKGDFYGEETKPQAIVNAPSEQFGSEVAYIDGFTYASQPVNDTIVVGRIDGSACITEIELVTSVTMGTAKFDIGDDTTADKFGSSVGTTSTANPAVVRFPKPMLVGGGQSRTRIVLKVKTAALPAAGTMRVITRFVRAGGR